MRKRMSGVAVGIVKDVNDPDGQGRIRVDLEIMPGNKKTYWAPVATVMAGNDRGTWAMPELEDEAVVAFYEDDPDGACILGFTWNGKDKPPSTTHKERVWKSLNGHAIRMLDSTPNGGNKGALIVEDAHKNRIVMTNTLVTIHSEGVLILDAKTIVLRGSGYNRVITPSNNPI